MRLLLISPKGPLYRHGTGVWAKSLRYQPLTLTLLAALVPEELDVDIEIVDESVRSVPLDAEADLVAMTVITGSAPRSYQLADHFRRRGVPVVLGGPHPTLLPDEAAAHADAVVCGYAEQSWPQVLRDCARGDLKPRYRQSPVHDLAGLPLPRRDLLPGRGFLSALTMEATRGCIHDCDFCVVPTAWGRKPYQRPIEEIVEEIRASGRRTVLFLDLNLIADVPYAQRLFEALIPLRIRWAGLATTLITQKPDLVRLAARSGCRGLLLGFESLVDEALVETSKGFNSPHRYRECVRELHRHQIAVQGCFVFGLDHDDPTVFRRSAGFAVDARIDLPRFAVLTPFPGTPLHTRLRAEGRILSEDWQRYDGQHVVFQPANMSPAQLQEGLFTAWKTAYSVAGIARRIVRGGRRFPLAAAANWAYRRYAWQLPRMIQAGGALAEESSACD